MKGKRYIFVRTGRNPALEIQAKGREPMRIALDRIDHADKFERMHKKLGCELWWTRDHEEQLTPAWLQLMRSAESPA